MGDVLSIVNEAIAMVAPDGVLDADDLADVEVIGIALSRLFDRNEKRGLMPRWVTDPRTGRTVLDSNGTPTDEEIAIAERHLAEMIAARQGPRVERPWDGGNVHRTVRGLSRSDAAEIFDTKRKWERHLAATGSREVSPYDARNMTRPTRDKKREQAGISETVARVLHHLRNTGQVDERGRVNPSAPLVPLEATRDGNGNGQRVPVNRMPPPDEPTVAQLQAIAKRDGLTITPSDAPPEIPTPDFPGAEIPYAARPPADISCLEAAQYDDVLAKAKSRARARGQTV